LTEEISFPVNCSRNIVQVELGRDRNHLSESQTHQQALTRWIPGGLGSEQLAWHLLLWAWWGELHRTMQVLQ